jgi:methionine-rich copper-binding protein CopC
MPSVEKYQLGRRHNDHRLHLRIATCQRDQLISNNKTGRLGIKMKNFLLAGMIGVWATGAIALSPLDGTTPAHEATVTEMPTEVLMDFKGDIRLTRVAVTHADTHSMDIDLGDQTAFTQEFALPMHDMGAGVYFFEWRGLGADGHALNGTFSFTVE